MVRWRRLKRSVLEGTICAAWAVTLVLAPSSAHAEGGKTISSAPLVAYGVHETGDTSNGGGGEFSRDCENQFDLNRNSFWQLPVTVGDQVTIDWGAVILDSTCLTVYPIGTNDFGLQSADPEHSTEQGSNGKQEMKFMAPASGNLILDFAATALYSGCTSCAGPYDFTAYLRHSLALNLTVPSTVPTNGVVTAAVSQNTGTPVPDGLSFWLLAKWYEQGEKKSYTTTATTAGGNVNFSLGLPITAAGHNVKFQAGRSEDSGYVEVLSNMVTAQAEAPVLPPRPHRHHRRHHRRHHHHHHHHHRHHR
jgi:hypothetical protein